MTVRWKIFPFLMGCLSFHPSCRLGLDGSDVISKHNAEIDISQAILGKTLSCGYSPLRALILMDLGSSKEHKKNSGKKKRTKIRTSKSGSIFYERKAVARCLRAIHAIPCPAAPPHTMQKDSEFVGRLIATRVSFCHFKQFYFWKKPNLEFQGRYY